MPIEGELSHWLPDPEAEPRLREQTVADLLDEAAAQWPQDEAIVYSAYDDVGIHERWSFAELRRRARDVARAFIADGFSAGNASGCGRRIVPSGCSPSSARPTPGS